MTTAGPWRRCSSCKTPIALGATYWVCNVSTCNRKRTGLAFCTVSCWDAHLPIARHRESWALEKTAPRSLEPEPRTRDREPERRAPRRIIATPAAPRASEPSPGGDRGADVPTEVLIIASRLKDYVRALSGYNTSDRALGPLSDIVRRAVDRAIQNARAEGRRTVLDRDVPKP